MDKVINKLKKLIAHEESARAIGNVAEAEAFAQKIQEWLTTHNLSMSEVEIHAAQDSPIDGEPVQDELTNIEDWHRVLLANIARINGCHPLEHRLGFQIVVGRQQDREIVINLYKYFEKLGEDLAEKFALAGQQHSIFSSELTDFYSVSSSFFNSETRRNSFLLGFVASVSQRLEEINRKQTAESENTAALVFLSNREKENKTWIDEKYKVDHEPIQINSVDKSAFTSGASAGNSVALTDKTLK